MLQIPDEDYHNSRVFGKDVQNGLAPDILANIDAALSMAPGPLPPADAQHFRAYVATDDSTKAKPALEIPAKKSMQPGAGTRDSAAPSPAMRPMRPERQGAKRRYVETSYAGYGEGFDEEAESTAGEGDGRSGQNRKKRKKVS